MGLHNYKIFFYNGLKKTLINLIQFLQIMWRLEKGTHTMCLICSKYV